MAAAAAADVAVVVVGSNGQWESEGHDRPDLSLPGRQSELVEAVLEVNRRTVVVVNAGSPVDMPWASRAGAVLMTWYPGEEGADALADMLVGLAEPSGRLPVTFPARVEDGPAGLGMEGSGTRASKARSNTARACWWVTASTRPCDWRHSSPSGSGSPMATWRSRMWRPTGRESRSR